MDPRQQQNPLPALHRSTKVSREDIVAALLRLRGDSSAGAAADGARGRGRLLPAHGTNVRRRRVLLRAVRKVALCCQAAGVRTAPALAATLDFFDFGPVDESRREAGRMRTVDLWHWLRLLSAPVDADGRGGVGASLGSSNNRAIHGGHKGGNRRDRGGYYGGGGGGQAGDGMVSGRLLDSEETSLLLDAVECRPAVGEVGEGVAASPMAPAKDAAESEFFVSIPAFWELLVKHVPGLWDRDLQARLEAEEVRRFDELSIYCMRIACHASPRCRGAP